MSDKPLPNYEQVAQQLRITRCVDCSEVNHDTLRGGGPQGTVRNGLLHWSDRATTRSGLRRFLHLAALANRPGGEPQWLRFYRAELLVYQWAHELGIRFPRHVNEDYRRELRAMLAGASKADPLYADALRFAHRR